MLKKVGHGHWTWLGDLQGFWKVLGYRCPFPIVWLIHRTFLFWGVRIWNPADSKVNEEYVRKQSRHLAGKWWEVMGIRKAASTEIIFGLSKVTFFCFPNRTSTTWGICAKGIFFWRIHASGGQLLRYQGMHPFLVKLRGFWMNLITAPGPNKQSVSFWAELQLQNYRKQIVLKAALLSHWAILSFILSHFISFYALSIHVSIILLWINPGLLEKRAKISSVAENPRFWMVDGDTGG